MKRSILLLGSGGLSIGQAGEFDYSGTQAIRSLLAEGFRVIVVNPNIATVQTDPQEDVAVYLYPVEAHWVERVIAKERP
ncbi:MAG: carbamoyl-phosphate synthase large subunit, partial [Elusimicrobia bacterium]